MKNLKYVCFGISIVLIVLAVIARLFFPEKVLFGLAPITYLRLTVVMLLYTITFHLLFKD